MFGRRIDILWQNTYWQKWYRFVVSDMTATAFVPFILSCRTGLLEQLPLLMICLYARVFLMQSNKILRLCVGLPYPGNLLPGYPPGNTMGTWVPDRKRK